MPVFTSIQLRDLQFSTTVNLMKSENERFQFIYATQVYQTLFALFARFEVTKSRNRTKINKIEFLGVNYKGPISLKIEEIQVAVDTTSPNPGDTDRIELPVLSIELLLSGTGSGTFSKLQDTVDDVEEPVKDGIMKVDLEIPKGTSLRVERTLRSLNNIEDKNELDLSKDAYWNGIFDSEFFMRDGFLIKQRTKDCLEFVETKHLQDHETGEMMKEVLEDDFGLSTIVCPIGVGIINQE